jgi:membrane protease YdiL (CAAX protease family)
MTAKLISTRLGYLVCMASCDCAFKVSKVEEFLGRFSCAIPLSTGQASFVPVLLFFVAAYAFTWVLHGLIVLLHLPFGRISKTPARVLYFLGLGGPLVAALVSAYLFYGQVGVVDMLSGALNWRVGVVWYVLAIAPVGIIYLVSAILYGLRQKKRVVLFKKPSRGVMLVLPQVWVVIAEEFGWRGFALPHLQGLFGWLGASFILGILWACWHLPMFFVPGSNQYKSSFPQYVFVLSVWSFFMAMLYYQTNGSVLLCMIFHATANLWAFTINVPEGSERFVLSLHLPMLLVAVTMLPF